MNAVFHALGLVACLSSFGQHSSMDDWERLRDTLVPHYVEQHYDSLNGSWTATIYDDGHVALFKVSVDSTGLRRTIPLTKDSAQIEITAVGHRMNSSAPEQYEFTIPIEHSILRVLIDVKKSLYYNNRWGHLLSVRRVYKDLEEGFEYEARTNRIRTYMHFDSNDTTGNYVIHFQSGNAAGLAIYGLTKLCPYEFQTCDSIARGLKGNMDFPGLYRRRRIFIDGQSKIIELYEKGTIRYLLRYSDDGSAALTRYDRNGAAVLSELIE